MLNRGLFFLLLAGVVWTLSAAGSPDGGPAASPRLPAVEIRHCDS